MSLRFPKCQLMVEGTDDCAVVERLLQRHGLSCHRPQPIEIQSYDGLPKIFESVKAAAKTYGRLGLMLDADDRPDKRWQEARYMLERAGVILPEKPDPQGTVVQGVRPPSFVGVWLMPDNAQPGKLEDFLAALIPARDSSWSYAQQATETARQHHGAPFRAVDQSKAQLRAWLAWQREPGLPLGPAIAEAYFRHDSPAALAFITWFRRLFLAPSDPEAPPIA